MTNITHQIEKTLNSEVIVILKAIGEHAGAQGQTIYMVGGVVRDLLLGYPSTDLDLVVEGNAINLARHLAKTYGGNITVHPRFGTAKVTLDSCIIDIVTARSETYSKPGALPTIEPGSIKSDLQRRDFSINAMAVDLSPDRFGELLDIHNGLNDLNQKLIRVLHRGSFVDDATRMLRAIRYEQRLHFQMETGTEQLIRRDIPMLDTISGDRLRHEVELILDEQFPEHIILRANELGILDQLHLPIKDAAWITNKFSEARRQHGKPDVAIYLALLSYNLSEKEVKDFTDYLKIIGELHRTMRDSAALSKNSSALSQPNLTPSGIYALLKQYSIKAIEASILATDVPVVKERLNLYLTTLIYVVPLLNGETLKQLGVAPGKQLGWMLHQLKNARMDQRVKTRKDEESLVRQWLKEKDTLHRQ